MASDEQIEEQIQKKGLNAPRVSLAQIEANIMGEHYFTAYHGFRGALAAGEYQGRMSPKQDDKDLVPLKLLTFCVLVLRNGFTVTGESACASPENFDADLGRMIARRKAVEKVWPLEGYLLKDRLSHGE